MDKVWSWWYPVSAKNALKNWIYFSLSLVSLILKKELVMWSLHECAVQSAFLITA